MKEIAVKDHLNYYQVKMAKLVEIQKNDRDSKQAARNLNDGKSRMHQLELGLTRIGLRCSSVVLREEYRLTEEQAGRHQLDLTASALTQRIAVLEGKKWQSLARSIPMRFLNMRHWPRAVIFCKNGQMTWLLPRNIWSALLPKWM